MYKQLIDKLLGIIQKEPTNAEAMNDLFYVIKEIAETDFNTAYETLKKLRDPVCEAMTVTDGETFNSLSELYKNILLFAAPYDFDSYLLFLEIERPPKERFYQPRRKTLKPIVDALQDLADDRLDELFLSLPPRTGKTTLLDFFCSWIMGRDSELSNLYSAYSDTITKAFYEGILEILTDPVTYQWQKVFPGAKIASTNAANETINIDRRKRYPSLTARSLYGTLNGACDCAGFLIADDLIGSIEEALNKDRLRSAWDKVTNNLIPRAKEGAKLLWMGTRWSLVDPIGRRLDVVENEPAFTDRRWKQIELPALNEDDESNFEYDYGVGFSTKHYHRIRAQFERTDDMASWNAQFQQQPVEREGAVFAPSSFKTYNGTLPEEGIERVFIPVDPAYGSGDYVSAPCLCKYGDLLYLPDVVYDNSDVKVTQPKVVRLAMKHNARYMRVEGTKSTMEYANNLRREFADRNYKINLTTKAAGPTQSKADRIIYRAPEIRDRVVLLEEGKRSPEYVKFLNGLFSYTQNGKNKHDDAPDSLAMAIDMIETKPKKRGRIVKRPF